jgi:REP element-mobilizing transposase RayT
MQIQRKSYSEINRTYFFTATIHQWLPLLAAKENKELIVDYLKELSARKMIKIYGFVIMPNHVHFIWEQLGKNGRKHPREAF